jgi:ubiquinone/menaquinone biosynthesis C-methylase UbiE
MNERPPDPDSLRYARHWEPVLAAPAQRVLARIEAEPATLLDLGAGTGSLTLAAARHWPSATIVALDASGAMLAVARSRVTQSDADPARFEWVPADAAAIPRADASVDAAVSSFVLQLVDDRAAVLAEVGRVLRPGGTFSFVVWLADDLVLPADAAYHEVLGDIAGEDEDEDFRSPCAGDYISPEQAHDELAEAGFEAVEVVPDELHYAWTAGSYLAFKEGYDDHERFDSLDEAARAQLHDALVDRLTTLPAEAFELRGPLVAGTARRPRRSD